MKTITLLRALIKEAIEDSGEKKKIYVLVGPPSAGKSTWISETFGDTKPYIINRDVLADKVAEGYRWSYDDMFAAPPKDAEEGDKDEKYGTVVKSPSWMTWQPLSFDKVLQANGEVQKLFSDRVASASGSGKDIVVDMTNMTAGARKGALKVIEGNEQDYEKIAVVFNFRGSEDLIMKVAEKRAEIAKRMGKSKTIPPDTMRKMFSAYQEVSPDEGFDQVIPVDKTADIKKFLDDKSLDESLRRKRRIR
jgi:hypothetical protein